MAELTLAELSAKTTPGVSPDDKNATSGITAEEAVKMGASDPHAYIPPKPPLSVLDRLAGLGPQLVAGTQIFGGQMMQWMGDLRKEAPGQVPGQQPGEDKLANSMVKNGLLLQENNKEFLDKNYPDRDVNLLSKTLNQVPPAIEMLTLAHFIGVPNAFRALVAQAGVQSAAATYAGEREKGLSVNEATAIALPVGGINALAAKYGYGLFKTEMAEPLKRAVATGVDAAIGSFLQGITGGVADMADGIHPYTGPDDFKNLIVDAATNAAITGVLFAPAGAWSAMKNQRSMENLFETELHMTRDEAELKTKEIMGIGANKVNDWISEKVNATPEQTARIMFLRPDALRHEVEKFQRLQAGTPLDEDYIPHEDKTIPEQTELQKNIAELESKKTDVKQLQDVLQDKVEHTILQKQILGQNKKAEDEVNAKHDDLLDEHQKNVADQQKEMNTRQKSEMTALLKEQKSLDSQVRKTPEDMGLRQKQGDVREEVARLRDTHEQERETFKADIESKRQELDANREKDLTEALKNIPLKQTAQTELGRTQAEIKRLQELIAAKKQELKPTGTKISQLRDELSRLNQGLRKGTKLHREEAGDVLKRFQELLSDKESGLLRAQDKTRFLSKMKEMAKAVDPEEKFRALMPDIKNMMNRLNEREETRQWRKDIEKINWDKVPVEFQDKLKPLLDALDLHYRTAKDVAIKKASVDYFERRLQSANPEDKLTFEEQEALKAARSLSISEMPHEMLRALHNTIMAEVTKAYRYDALSKSEHAQMIVKEQQAVIDFNLKGKELAPADTFGENNEELNKSWFEKALKLPNWVGEYAKTPMTIFKATGGFKWFEKCHENDVAERQQTMDDLNQIGKLFRTLKMNDVIGKPIPKEFEYLNTKRDYTGDRAGSLNAYMKIYAQSQNENGLEHLNGSGLSDVLVGKIQEWMEKDYPEATKTIRNVFEYFKPGGEAFERLDAQVVLYRGHHLSVEENYDPIQRLINVPLSDMAWGTKGMYGRATPFSGFINPRRGSTLAFKDFDYVGDLVRHIYDTNHFINNWETLADMHAIYHDPAVMKAIRSSDNGDLKLQYIHKYIEGIAFGTHAEDSALSRQLSAIRQNFAISHVAGNITSALKVCAQYPISAQYVGGNWQNKAMLDYSLHPDEINKFIDERSNFMKNRWFTQEPALTEFTERDREMFGKSADIRNFQKFAMLPHQIADRLITRATWLGMYNRTIAEITDMGFTKEEAEDQAIKKADMAVYETHPTGSNVYLPQLFKEGEIGRLLGMFHNAVTKNYNLWVQDIEGFKAGEKNVGDLAGAVLARGLIPAFMIGMFDLKRNFQKDELPAYVVNQTLGTNPVFRFLTQAWVDGEFKGLELPPNEAIQNLWDAIFKPGATQKIKRGLEAVGDFTGIPIGVLYRELSGTSFSPRRDRR